MASCKPIENDDVSKDSEHVSDGRNCGAEQFVTEEDSCDERPHTEGLEFVPVAGENACRSLAATSRSTTNTFAITDAVTRSATRVVTTPYNQQVQNAHHSLVRSERMASSQQRYLSSHLGLSFSLHRTAHNVVSETSPDFVPPLLHGPLQRPLSTAAIRQNAMACKNREYTAFSSEARYISPHTQVYKSPPVRYDNVYDNLMGIRSIQDGTPAANTEKDGDIAIYAIRFTRQIHNGLKFGRGHLHITTENRHLVEARQARTLAGLTTEAIDGKIMYRVLRDFDSWGWLG